ncbi:F-box/LRR-repeat protein [Trifolium pratense]|uniref:F-box/LRR-repeat protein n=1 Tax=Trifolium pratense TaxID=57577 RepID=A0A2K3N8H2_TRIPR|nr:F-box/LRR-repeat protein [Trifolium pratense]
MKRQRTELVYCSDLPDDCWEHVFRFVNEDGEEEEEDNNRRHYLNSISLVSKQFLSISNRHKLCLRICHPTLPFLHRLLHRFTNLTTLDLSHLDVQLNDLLIQISTFPFDQLTSLNISNQSSLPAIGLQAFSSTVTSLTSLTASNLGVFDIIHDFKLISDCFPFLQQLDLSNPGKIIGCKSLLTIPFALFKLRKVNLSDHGYINDQFVFYLFKNCNFLQEAIMLGCYRITNHGIASALPHTPNLRSLFLTPSLSMSPKYPMSVTSNLIHSFTILKALTCLDLSSWCISDHFLSSIANQSLPLTRLSLGYCTGYTYTGILAFLSKCLSIQHLELQQSADFLTDHHVAELSSFLPHLVSINLSCCRKLTDSAFFALIRNCTSLTEIVMQCTGIAENTASQKNSMDSVVYPQFKSLCLAYNSSLEDDKIIMFASLFPNLQLLDLSCCYGITEQGIGQVLRTCCKIRHLNLYYCLKRMSLGINFELPNLEVLDLATTRLSDEALYVISMNCPALLKLSLLRCEEITDKGIMDVVTNCTKLREIILGYCRKVHAKVVKSMVLLRPSLRKIVAPPSIHLTNRNRKFFSRHGCLLV